MVADVLGGGRQGGPLEEGFPERLPTLLGEEVVLEPTKPFAVLDGEVARPEVLLELHQQGALPRLPVGLAVRVIALQVVPAVRICSMSMSSQPAVRPLTRRLACFVSSVCIRFSASRRSSAKFSAALPNRARHWSSWNTTSSTQCCEFSIPQ